jgi:Sec-independent protein translocase protein TatA
MKMEHGPRSLRKRRQVDEHNEVDAQLPEETTQRPTEETVDKTTDHHKNDNSSSSTTSFTSTNSSTKTDTTSELPPVQNNQFSLMDLFRRVAEIKLKMGIEILRNTAASFTQYVSAIQRRMTHMVRNLQKSNDRQQTENKQEHDVKVDSTTADEEKRQRRSIRHRIYSN